MDIFLLIVGLVLVLVGANYMTDGASSIAARFNVSPFVIGLTVVAIGTSAPELIVSVLSAIRGSDALAVGNVVGSNLVNTLLIVGVTALIAPLRLSGANVRIDIPFGVLAAITLFICASDTLLGDAPANVIQRSEGLLLLCFLVIFMFYTFLSARIAKTTDGAEGEADRVPRQRKLWLALVMVAGGLAGLIYGGDLFLDHATALARRWGMSEAVIGVTLVAAGTSLPELAASVVAALKGQPGLALGNILGSNVLNIFMVLGVSATIRPLGAGDIAAADLMVVVLSTLLLFMTAFTFKKQSIDRWEGALFVIFYVAYIVWVLVR